MSRPSMADTPAEVEAIFRCLPGRLRSENVVGYTGTFHWIIEGAATPEWTVVITNGTCDVRDGLHGDPVCAVTLSEALFLGIETGRRNPVTAFVNGRIRATNVGQLRRYDLAFYKFHEVPEP